MTNWDKILGDIIRPFLASEHQQTFDYIFLGGKKIRPSYIEKLCHFYKKEAKPLYHAAAAIELFHAFSLVHDDIVDNESERRGKLPLHREKSVSEAILYGDFFTQ